MTLSAEDILQIDRMIQVRIREATHEYPYVKECSAINENSDLVHIHKEELHQLQEKAKKWDNYNNGHIVSLVTGEEKENSKNWNDLRERFHLDTGQVVLTVTEWREKAKKWDEMDMTHVWVRRGEYGELKDKAEKWDNINSNPNLKVNDEITLRFFHEISEWKDKARKWDSFTDDFELGGENVLLKVGEWRGKAKNWDKITLSNGTLDAVKLLEWKEKAELLTGWFEDYRKRHNLDET